MSTRFTANIPTEPHKSTFSGFDHVLNILFKEKFPFEVVEMVFEYLPITYLESIGAKLEQLVSYSKYETFGSLQNQIIGVNGAYEINHDGTVITSNIDFCTTKHIWFLCKPIFMRFMFAKFKKDIIDYLFMFHSDIQNVVYLARFNRLDLCEIVYSETDSFNGIVHVVDHASFNGNLEIVKYLTAIDASCSIYAMVFAAQCGHLDIVQWLHFNGTEGCSTYAMDWAARRGHLDIVKWLHFNRSEGCTTRAMDWAAEFGYLDIVQWLHLNRSEGCSEYAMIDAARNGHIAIVKYLYENSLATDRDLLKYVIKYVKRTRFSEIEVYLESVLAIDGESDDSTSGIK